MTDTQTTPTGPKPQDEAPAAHDLHEYAGGLIKARLGIIPVWLLVVYFVLFIWACYYIVRYWGGLGPGRIG